MKTREALAIAAAVKLALSNSARHGGPSTDRGLGIRYGAYDIANEAWYEAVKPANLKRFPDRPTWMEACGFEKVV